MGKQFRRGGRAGFVFSVMVSSEGFWGVGYLFWLLRYGNYDGILGMRFFVFLYRYGK